MADSQNKAWIKARQTRYGAFAFFYIVVVLAIVVVANWLANHNNKSVDVTANKRYTLSDQTIKVVTGLKKPVKVYYFDKSDQYDRARDMMDRYRNLSPNFEVSYVDPDKNPDLARVEGMHSFGDIVLDNGVKKETAKALTEEELTGALVRVLKTNLHMACFINGSGEHTLEDTDREGYSALKDQLEKNNIKTQTISLIEKPEVPKTCTILVVAGPKRDYLQPEIDAIRNFVKGGGRAMFNFDPVLNLPGEKMGDTPALAKLVEEYGITPKGDVILDLGAASRLFGQLSPVVGSYESHVIVRPMQDNATVYPLARSLEVKAPAEKLFSSTQDSFSLTDPKLPIKESDLDKAAKGPFVLGAAATVGSGDTQGRVVVVGSSNWISNNIIAAPVGNRDLVLNMMNWLTSDEELISIRPKEPEDRRLTVSGNSMRFLFLTSVIFLPLFVIISGISVWAKRR
ncbi:MAG TPA: GldG family protein [Bryobacteraceae bacterium]|nr:GldG family protein [Bryobacteraceae bacterium]